jgi:predicted nucleic acid-binding protein
VSGCVFFTDMGIAALDRSDSHHRRAASTIRELLNEEVPLSLSLVNYAETLVRPAEDETLMRQAVDGLKALGIRVVAPTRAIAEDAARHRLLGISLADGFALGTAQAQDAAVASFDRRVRRAAAKIGLDLRL